MRKGGEMIAEGVEYVRRASPLNVAPTPEIRRAVAAQAAAHDATRGA
jgi:hypothetical protein